MASFSFNAAGIDFLINGDAPLIALIATYYARFPGPHGGRKVTLEWRENECRWSGDQSGLLRVAGPAVRASATTIAVTQLLANLNPSFLLLHGNALVHRNNERVLLLLGDSGAGKTTLAHELIASGEWLLVAEDSIIIDGTSILPFPRASTIRNAATPDWQPLGADAPSKGLQLPPSYCKGSVSLGSGDVVILHDGGTSSTAASFAEKVWTTYWDEEVGRLIRETLPLKDATFQGTVWRAEYARPLSPEERQREAEILTQFGSMIVHSQRNAESRLPGVSQRPLQPSARDLTAKEFLVRSLHFLHSARGAVDAMNAGLLCLRISQAFRNFRFIEFMPGGSARESALALRLQATPQEVLT